MATCDLCQRMLRLFENISPKVNARNSFISTANGRIRLNDAVNSSPNQNSDANISTPIIFHSTEFSFRIISVIIISFGRLFLAKVCSLSDCEAKGVRRDRNCITSDCVSLARPPMIAVSRGNDFEPRATECLIYGLWRIACCHVHLTQKTLNYVDQT